MEFYFLTFLFRFIIVNKRTYYACHRFAKVFEASYFSEQITTAVAPFYTGLRFAKSLNPGTRPTLSVYTKMAYRHVYVCVRVCVSVCVCVCNYYSLSTLLSISKLYSFTRLFLPDSGYLIFNFFFITRRNLSLRAIFFHVPLRMYIVEGSTYSPCGHNSSNGLMTFSVEIPSETIHVSRLSIKNWLNRAKKKNWTNKIIYRFDVTDLRFRSALR